MYVPIHTLISTYWILSNEQGAFVFIETLSVILYTISIIGILSYAHLSIGLYVDTASAKK